MLRSLSRTRSLLMSIGALTGLSAALVVVPATAPAFAAGDPCGPTGNAIACENSRPGSPPSEWDIDGAGDEGIQGFSTDISVNVGSRIDFKIDTSASDYDITIYRSGYYGGDGARKIAEVQPSAALPQIQPQCITDVNTELYDCGNWGVSASWNVPATAVSGVYFARLSDPATQDESHITFIVRNDASHSELVFQTSDTTWQAYNTYGGSNFYNGGANGRAYALSYNRPVTTRSGTGGRDFYFANEYPMVRFLEKNGYDVSYVSGVDVHRAGQLLTNHETYLSVGHDEYWSGQQRAHVEAARDAGVNLMFLSGNEMYWRTRFAPSAVGAVPNRTLVSYKETWANEKIDPTSEWTGTWRDPRFAPTSAGGGRPENAVTGTAYMANYSDLAIQVSAREGKLRLWRNTPLASLAAGATATLAPHTIGYESNEDLDNGSRPQGLVRLSTTTGAVSEYLQDFGNNVAPGTTTHNLTMYRAPSGALVFSAGSVQWTWGLDGVHDSPFAPEPADPRMKQAQVNLLADMGAQPTTLDATLTQATASADTAGPTVTINAPAAGASLANGVQVTATGSATDAAGRVAGVEVSTDNGATWHPATGTDTWSYTYVQHSTGATPLKVRAIDDSANIGASTTRTLQVSCPCSVFGAEVPETPAANDASGAELGLKFSPAVDGFVSGVRFYKAATNTGTHVGSLWSTGGQRLATVTFTNESGSGWQRADFATPVPVTAGQTYVVSYTAPNGRYAVQSFAFSSQGISAPPLSVAGGYEAEPAGVFADVGRFPVSSFRKSHYFVDALFTTVDESPLRATDQLPVVDSSSVAVATTVAATFSKAVVAGTAAIAVRDAEGTSVAGTTAYDASTRRIVFTPTAPLNYLVRYTATLSGTDNQGNAVSTGKTWSFETARPASAPGVCTCTLFDDTLRPERLHDPDATSVTLGVRFAAEVDGTVTGVRFFKGPENTGTHTGTLWSMNGTALATGTFVNESSTGWQTLMFAQPVPVTRDIEYIASYVAPQGRYSATVGAFSSANLSRPPLRVASNSGSYTYSGGFPSSRSNASYLVDVMFERLPAAIEITAQDPVPGALDIARDSNVGVWFSAPVTTGFQLAVTVGGSPVAGTTSQGPAGKSITFDPTSALPRDTLVNVSLTGVVSTDGAVLPARTWSFRTTTSEDTSTPQTLFGALTPQTASVNDPGPLEIGTAFTPAVDGTVTHVRFFKGGTDNGGNHTGSVWSLAGERLATVAFTNETPSGWQSARLATPLPVSAGTTYVVSYFAPQGHYSATPGFFAAPHTSGDLSAPGSNNGRYLYGPVGGFPSQSFGGANYFVDVAFSTGNVALAIADRTPAPNATQVARTSPISVTFTEPITAAGSLAVTTGTTTVAGTVARSADARTMTFTPTAPLPANTVVTATVSGVTSADGDTLGPQSWSFTTQAPAAMTIDSRSPASGATAVARTTPVTLTLSQPAAPGGTVTVTGPAGAVAGTTTRSADARTLTFTPSASMPALTQLTVTVAGIVSVEGAALGTQTWSFTTQAVPAMTIASRSPIAGATAVSRTAPITVTFSQPAAPGGALSVSGPAGAVAGTTTRSADARTLTFTPSATMPALTQLTVTVAGIVSVEGAALGTQTWSFTTQAVPAMTIASRSPVAGATAVSRTAPITVTFSQPAAPGGALSVSGPAGAVAGTTTRSADARTLTFTPGATMPALTQLTVTVAGIVSAEGAALGTQTWSFTTEPRPVITTTIFGNTAPAAVASNTQAVEVGTHFTPTQSGQVTAIRFYKAAANTGVHTVSLWRANGTRLSRVTVTGETASGWQTMQLPTAIQLTAGTAYVVSYTSLTGRISLTTNFFPTAPFVSGPLQAVRSQNARYRYGTTGAFPNSIATGTNYFVDVVFRHEGP